MKINQEHTVLPNGEVQIGDLVVGPAGLLLMEAAKKYRANMAKIRLAEMMEEAMKKEKLNQVDLAKYLGVTKQAVNKMLNGSTNFTVETLIRLEEVLYADFISSALYKDEAMRMEYGVHYGGTQMVSNAFSVAITYSYVSYHLITVPSVFTEAIIPNGSASKFTVSRNDHANAA
jgi:transcriptional regulator with XRE-family HTH domain